MKKYVIIIMQIIYKKERKYEIKIKAIVLFMTAYYDYDVWHYGFC